MNPWPFVIGAYAIALVATVAMTVLSLLAMRRAEAQADRIGRDS
jgi:Zn-dependent protease with chaperone function